MQNCIQTVERVSSQLIDWPEKLQITQDIKLLNDVLEALGPEPKHAKAEYMKFENV